MMYINNLFLLFGLLGVGRIGGVRGGGSGRRLGGCRHLARAAGSLLLVLFGLGLLLGLLGFL